MVLNEWSVLGTGTWQRQLEGWITLAHDFRGLQFILEFMAMGVWLSPSHGKAPGSRERASKGRYVPQTRIDFTFHRFHSLPSEQRQQLGTTVRSTVSRGGQLTSKAHHLKHMHRLCRS